MLERYFELDHDFIVGDKVKSKLDYQKKYDGRFILAHELPNSEDEYEVIGITQERMILNGEEKTRIGLHLSGTYSPGTAYNAKNFVRA